MNIVSSEWMEEQLMLGAIIGDIVGSRFEWSNIKTKEFDFLTHSCFFTDDSVMSLAIAKAILETKQPTQLMDCYKASRHEKQPPS